MVEKAAAYHFHLCANHPFVDGNKRVAVATSEVFLRVNGFELGAGNEELEEMTIEVASGRLRKEQVVDFFVQHVVEV